MWDLQFLNCPLSLFVATDWLVVPLIMQVILIKNIRAMAKPVFSGGYCSHAIFRRLLYLLVVCKAEKICPENKNDKKCFIGHTD